MRLVGQPPAPTPGLRLRGGLGDIRALPRGRGASDAGVAVAGRIAGSTARSEGAGKGQRPGRKAADGRTLERSSDTFTLCAHTRENLNEVVSSRSVKITNGFFQSRSRSF